MISSANFRRAEIDRNENARLEFIINSVLYGPRFGPPSYPATPVLVRHTSQTSGDPGPGYPTFFFLLRTPLHPFPERPLVLRFQSR